MRTISINDLPERYQQQVRAQLEAHHARRFNTKPEQDKSPALVGPQPAPEGMVHSDRPLFVRITRIGGRQLDSDNLAGGCKELRDAIAAAFGRKGDSSKDGFTWEYVQENSD